MSAQILDLIPEKIKSFLEKRGINELRPCQDKSIQKGLFENNRNQLICTPTASGKTLVAELAILDAIVNKHKKAIYIVPLKALASEKYREFVELYGDKFKIRISIGDLQNEKYNYDYDILFVTAEKLDSLLRHNKEIIENLGVLVCDEIHLLNDEKRGPTLEILISIFLSKYPRVRIIGLSATVGNAKEISKWLKGDLIEDEWRPVELQHFVYFEDEMLRYK